MSKEKLDEMLVNSGVPDNQAVLVEDIFSASKFKNSKSWQYSKNWMLSCLLFQIRYVSVKYVYKLHFGIKQIVTWSVINFTFKFVIPISIIITIYYIRQIILNYLFDL